FSRDWSSDVCSSDLIAVDAQFLHLAVHATGGVRNGLHYLVDPFLLIHMVGMGQRADGSIAEVPMVAFSTKGAAFKMHAGNLASRSEERRVGKERTTR